jgi:hypothetical protein
MSSSGNQNQNTRSGQQNVAFDPQRPQIVQPWKSLVGQDLFVLHAEFGAISTVVYGVPTQRAINLDSELNKDTKYPVSFCLDWSTSKVDLKPKGKKVNKPSKQTETTGALPKKSLDVRDFELNHEQFFNRVKDVVSRIAPGSVRSKVYSSGKFGSNVQEVKTTMGFGDSMTLSGLWDYLVKNNHSDVLLSIMTDKPHYDKIIKDERCNIEKLLQIQSFPVPETETLVVFKIKVEAETEG